MRKADLHIHTDASDDASQTIESVFARAAEIGLTAVTISDHEGMVQWAAGRRLAHKHGLIFLPGIEISSSWNEELVHVLGFFPRGAGQAFERFLRESVWQERRRVQTEVLAHLMRDGAPLTLAEFEAEVQTNPSGTFHLPLYRLLKRKGMVSNAMDYVVMRNEVGVAFHYPTVQEVIEGVHAGGGIVVLAHPGNTAPGFHQFTTDEIATLADAGLDGIEVFHRSHDEEKTQMYAGAADRAGIAKFGGSDSHHANSRLGNLVGDHYCDWDEVLRVIEGD